MKKPIKISKTKALWIKKNSKKVNVDKYGQKTYYLDWLYGTSLEDIMIDHNGILAGNPTISYDIELAEESSNILEL